MAATCEITTIMSVKGLGTKDYELAWKCTHDSTPIEIGPTFAVIGSSASNLDLGAITDTALRAVQIIAKSGNIGVLVNDVGTGTPSATAGNILIKEGQSALINLGGGLTSGYYIRVIGSAVTASFEYLCWGA